MVTNSGHSRSPIQDIVEVARATILRAPVPCAVRAACALAGERPGVSARLAHHFHHLGHHLRVLLEEGVELVLVLHERLQLLLGHTDGGR